MIVLLVLVITTCSSYSHLTIVRGQQSSIYQDNSEYNTEKGYDKNMISQAVTKKTGRPEWMRFWFARSMINKVVIRKGHSHSNATDKLFSVYVYYGEIKALCGTYRTIGRYFDMTVECGDRIGESVSIEVNHHINMFEIEVWPRAPLSIIRGEQSSLYRDNASLYRTEFAYDKNTSTSAFTTDLGRPEWMRFYFARSYLVQKVVIVELWSPASTSGSNVYSIFVLDGEVKTLCGTFTAQEQSKVEDATVQCGGNLPRY